MQIDPFSAEFTVDKVHVAHWQLSAAIRMHFSGENPALVLALAGNASEVFGALVEHHCPDRSWDKQAREVCGLSRADYYRILREGQNFLKHADNDPTGRLTWSADSTEALMIGAVLNAGELDGGLAPVEIVYRDWYFVLHLAGQINPQQFMRDAEALFPGLREMPVRQQRAFGLRRVIELEATLNAAP